MPKLKTLETWFWQRSMILARSPISLRFRGHALLSFFLYLSFFVIGDGGDGG
jgi:hypothetical protein